MILAMQKLCALAESSSMTPVLPMILTHPAMLAVTLHHQPTRVTLVGSFGTQNHIKLLVISPFNLRIYKIQAWKTQANHPKTTWDPYIYSSLPSLSLLVLHQGNRGTEFGASQHAVVTIETPGHWPRNEQRQKHPTTEKSNDDLRRTESRIFWWCLP